MCGTLHILHHSSLGELLNTDAVREEEEPFQVNARRIQH